MFSLQAEFEISPREQRLDTLARRYIDETEAYDRSVCTGPIIDGTIYPSTARERGLINAYAQGRFQATCAEAEVDGFSKCDVRKAIQRSGRQ